jgi:hypothetical protein
MTANPGISSKMRWAGVQQQITALNYSRIQLAMSKKDSRIQGVTNNVALLSLNLDAFTVGSKVKIVLDSLAAIEYQVKEQNETIYLEKTLSGNLDLLRVKLRRIRYETEH